MLFTETEETRVGPRCYFFFWRRWIWNFILGVLNLGCLFSDPAGNFWRWSGVHSL